MIVLLPSSTYLLHHYLLVLSRSSNLFVFSLFASSNFHCSDSVLIFRFISYLLENLNKNTRTFYLFLYKVLVILGMFKRRVFKEVKRFDLDSFYSIELVLISADLIVMFFPFV